MKMSDVLSEANFNDLHHGWRTNYTNASHDMGITDKTVVSKEKVKQGFFKRLMKKLTASMLLGMIGVAGGPIGVLAGVGSALVFTGKKYKTKKVITKVKGVPVEEFYNKTGIKKDIEIFYNKFFSVSTINNLNINFNTLLDILYDESIEDDGGWLSIPVIKDKSTTIEDSDNEELVYIRRHLNKAAEYVENIAKKHNLKIPTVVYIFIEMYGDSPFNIFFKQLKNQ